MTRRLDQAASDKEGVLQEVEEVAPLTITQLPSTHPTLLELDQVGLTVSGCQLFDNLSFKVAPHDCVLLTGDNGSGKSSLIKAIMGQPVDQVTGAIRLAHGTKVSLVRQQYTDQHGSLTAFAQRNHLPVDQLLNMLRKLGMERASFTTPIDQMSMGQQKKVELTRSLLTPAQLYIWDEPLNYLDTYNQEQLVQLIKQECPAMLIIEHDQHFIDEVATKCVTI